MVSATTTLLLLLALVSLAVAAICPQGKQFLNNELQKCVNCTVCDSEKGMVVLTPCEVHKDTRCVPLSELTLVWNKDHHAENPHRHNHMKEHRRKEHRRNDHNSGKRNRGGDGEDTNIANGSNEAGVGHGVSDGAVDDDGGASSGSGTAIGVTNSEVPFSSIEALVWDWQAIALTLAVFSCILFFLIIALYSLHQARQWRRLKENFEAGTVWAKTPQERYVWI
ncbi:putative tumor necrosis factor receptor/nerve growth factor receptor [Trypoxylus dichotomus]